MNGAPRRWWNILDKALRRYGMVPIRACRCCHVLYSFQSREQAWEHWIQGAVAQWNGTNDAITESRQRSEMELAFEKTLDPSTEDSLDTRLPKRIEVSQDKEIDELEENPVERNTKKDLHCTRSTHAMCRSLLGHIIWLQSWAQFQCCFKFPDALRWQLLQQLAMWSLPTNWRDKSNHGQWTSVLAAHQMAENNWISWCFHQNNDDCSSQTGMTVFLAKSCERFSWDGMTCGSLINLKKIVFSTIVAEMFSFMLARNPVTKARTIHLPELKKTIHIVFTLRKRGLFR